MSITGVSPVEPGPRWPWDWDPKRDTSRLGTPSWARCPCYRVVRGRTTYEGTLSGVAANTRSNVTLLWSSEANLP